MSSEGLTFFGSEELIGLRARNYWKSDLTNQKSGEDESLELTIMHFNIQGLTNKFNLIEVENAEVLADFICISEHWLKQKEIDTTYLSGFKLANYFCRSTHNRGGVCIYVKNKWYCESVNLEKFCVEKDIEISALKCNLEECVSVFVLVVYRSPSGNFNSFILNLNLVMDEIFDIQVPIILSGDFNVDFSKESREKNTLCHLLGTYGLAKLVSEPTRVTATSATVIDNIFTNIDSDFGISVRDVHFSDHRSQVLSIKLPKANIYSRTHTYCRHFSEPNNKIFAHLLTNETWQTLVNETATDLESGFENYITTLNYYFNVSFPIVKSKSTTKQEVKQWLNEEITESSKQLKALFRVTKMQNSEEICKLYKIAKTKHAKLVRDTKQTYNHSIVTSSKNSSKSLWYLVKKFTTNDANSLRKHEYELQTENGVIHDRNRIVNMFSDFFVNQPLEILKNIPRVPSLNMSVLNHYSMFFHPIDQKEIIDLVVQLNNSNSTGGDEISNNTLKKFGIYISKPLASLINECFRLGCFPNVL